jgi:hypothetical protein
MGGSLLGQWGLPMPVVEAVAMHHHPAQLLSRDFCPLTAVHAANGLTRARSLAEARERLDLGYLRELGVERHLEGWWECTVTARAAGELA